MLPVRNVETGEFSSPVHNVLKQSGLTGDSQALVIPTIASISPLHWNILAVHESSPHSLSLLQWRG